MINYWELAKDFKIGDAVQKINPTNGSLSPFIGKVTASHPGLGVVDVQWAFGNCREFPDELVKVNPSLSLYLPPSLDQSYSSFDIEKARKTKKASNVWQETSMPANFYQKLAGKWNQGCSSVVAYDDLYREYCPNIDDELLRVKVSTFYRVASNLMEMRVSQHAEKTAAYWFSQNRTYRATQKEMTHGKPLCPKCGSTMKKTTYKMSDGERTKLFACPRDLFLLKPSDILSPTGDPVDW